MLQSNNVRDKLVLFAEEPRTRAFLKASILLDSGQWTVDSGQWTVDSGQWTVDSGQWTVDSGQWTVDSGQWTVDSGQCVFNFLPNFKFSDFV